MSMNQSESGQAGGSTPSKLSLSPLGTPSNVVNVLDHLKRLLGDLNKSNQSSIAAASLVVEDDKTSLMCLKKIGEILKETDISSFEMIHSGLIESLAQFVLVRNVASNSTSNVKEIGDRSPLLKTKPIIYLNDLSRVLSNEQKVLVYYEIF